MPEPVSGRASAPDSVSGSAPRLTGAEVWRLLGGTRGVAESVVPAIVFVVADLVWSVVWVAAVASLVSILVLVASRALWPGDRSRSGLWSGVVLAAISAGLSLLTGRAGDNFLPGIIVNAVFALVLLGSLVLGRPLLGFVFGAFLPAEARSASSPLTQRAGVAATWVWVGVMALRLLVEVPLYLASLTSGDVVWLGGARIILGVPLFSLGSLASWALLRPVVAALEESESTEASTSAEG